MKTVIFCVALLATGTASAYPVEIGAYQEIYVGVSAKHAYATQGVDGSRSNRSRYQLPRQQPAELWKVQLKSRFLMPPVVSKENILLVGHSEGVTALNAQGALLWSASVGRVAAVPSLNPSGQLVVGTREGEVVILSMRGQVLSRTQLSSSITSSPLVMPDSSVVVALSNGDVVVLSSELQLMFRRKLSAEVLRAPVYAGFNRFSVSVPHFLRVLNTSGREVYSVNTETTSAFTLARLGSSGTALFQIGRLDAKGKKATHLRWLHIEQEG